MNVHLLPEQLVAVTQKLDELWKLDNLLLLRLLLLLLLLPRPRPLRLRLLLLLLLLFLLLLGGGGFATKLYADTKEKQKRRTGCQQLSRRHMLTNSEVSILCLPVKKKPLT